MIIGTVVTVSQGGLDGPRGLYHLKLVDELTKFQLVGSVERLDAACLAPILDAVLQEFPFMIRGFHPDAAPERVNRERATRGAASASATGTPTS